METQKLIIVIKDSKIKKVFAFNKENFDKVEQTFLDQCNLLYDGIMSDDQKVKVLNENIYSLCNSSVVRLTAPLLGQVSLINVLS